MERLEVSTFKSAGCLPFYVAQHLGLFEKEDIELSLHFTASSEEQMRALIDGKIQIASTAADNVIAWGEGQGADHQRHDLVIFIGGDRGQLALCTQPQLESIRDLRGGKLGVDAVDTGFALVLLKILKQNGLSTTDYELTKIGATNLRFEALKKGEIIGTMLTPPYDGQARAAGFKVLAQRSDYLPEYISSAGAVLRSWAEMNRDLLVRYIKSYVAAIDWASKSINRGVGEKLIAENLGLDSQAASKAYARLVDPTQGYTPKVQLSIEGLRKVLELRAEITGLNPVPSVEKYYVSSYYEEGLRALG